ncbi:MAG: elongation factor P [Candidatus Omnitrophica bacterium]|nr:elongation factor P [Candidatus Omnitrophota bacterium]MDD5487346.1 elongation factor P [Candidatus Omnitrophota bacterium]
MIRAVQLRPGTVIEYNNSLHEVVEAQHYKPGKGGAFVRSKLRNLTTGAIVSETLRPDDTFEQAFIEQKSMQYLYRDDLGYCFMDDETFEQVHLSEDKIGDKKDFLKENMTVTAKIFDGQIMSVDPPIHVVLEIIETEPGFKGNTVSGATKPATLETGRVVKVPLFVGPHERVKVDTRTGEYIERA